MTNPHTFSFVDLCGFTSLTGAHGDEDAAAIAFKFYAMAEAVSVKVVVRKSPHDTGVAIG